jgi:hypothetical protein
MTFVIYIPNMSKSSFYTNTDGPNSFLNLRKRHRNKLKGAAYFFSLYKKEFNEDTEYKLEGRGFETR